MDKIIYFELNNWIPGIFYPDDEPFRLWMKNDLQIKFDDETWVKKSRLCVVIQTVPWDSIAALYDGKYGVKIPPKHLYDMFVRKQSYLDKINAQNIAKGKDITGVSRVKYDLKVLYNKYDSYLKFLEKQKILEAEAQSDKTDEKLILTTAPQPKTVETNNNSDDSLDDLLNDIFG